MVVIQPKHLAAWKRADPVTVPSADEKPPTYGAWHRKRAERRVEVEPEREGEPPKLEGMAGGG